MSVSSRQASNRMLEPRLTLLTRRYLKFSLRVGVRALPGCRDSGNLPPAWMVFAGGVQRCFGGMGAFEFKKMAKRRDIK